MRSITAILLTAAFAATLHAQEKPNLLKNGDFEEVKSDSQFEAWRSWARDKNVEHKVSDEAHSGKHSGYLTATDKGYHGGYVQVLKLKAGCRYKYSAWFKFRNHGTGNIRCCYEETNRLVGDDRKYINTIAGIIKDDCDWTYMENTFDTLPDKDSDYSLHVMLAYDDCEAWVDDARLVDCGPVLVVDNGAMRLHFGYGIHIVRIAVGKEDMGTLGCAIAEFEKEGVGYKNTGIGSAGPAQVRSFEVKERSESKCIVDVTCEWPESSETKRKYEAVYRITILAGQPWFESRLLSIRNTDTVAYKVEGYYHCLQPAEPGKALPRCFPACAAWVGGGKALGAAIREPGDFTLGFRKVDEEACGDVTRKLGFQLTPGMTWEKQGPGIFVFVTDGNAPDQIVEMRRRILTQPAPTGKLSYEEAKAESN